MCCSSSHLLSVLCKLHAASEMAWQVKCCFMLVQLLDTKLSLMTFPLQCSKGLKSILCGSSDSGREHWAGRGVYEPQPGIPNQKWSQTATDLHFNSLTCSRKQYLNLKIQWPQYWWFLKICNIPFVFDTGKNTFLTYFFKLFWKEQIDIYIYLDSFLNV